MLDENACSDELPILQWSHRVALRRLLVRLSKAAGVLPMSIFLSGVECTDRNCIAGGGFADIYLATYKGRKVALKRLRVYHLGKRETDMYHVVSTISLSLVPLIGFMGYTDLLSGGSRLEAVMPS